MPTPPPPSQQQANAAQSARYAAENAALALFNSTEVGQGSGEDEHSVLQSIKVAAILATLSSAIIIASFSSPDRTKSALLIQPDHEQFADAVLPDAQKSFDALLDADLDNKQKAVIWSTWAYSRVADEIARAINRGDIPHEYADGNQTLKKVWISRSDARVRPLHLKLHGRAVGVDTDFWRWPATGQRLRWPGDKEAPPEATYGCRCVCLLSWASQDEVSEMIHQIVEHTRKSGEPT